MKPAHVHLISVLKAELAGAFSRLPDPIRILDTGCGYGGLIVDLLSSFAEESRWPSIEIYGYEVFDHRGSTPGYREAILANLRSFAPSIDWGERIRLADATAPWPFVDGFFHVVLSNQVLEHVQNLDTFFHESWRVLSQEGLQVHFYPSQHVIVEPHSGVPFLHWLRDLDARQRWIIRWSRWGLGKFRSYRKVRGSTLEGFAEEFADYLERYVFFRSNAEIRSLASRPFCQCGFKYDRALLSRSIRDDWEPAAYRFDQNAAAFSALARFACSTLVARRVRA